MEIKQIIVIFQFETLCETNMCYNQANIYRVIVKILSLPLGTVPAIWFKMDILGQKMKFMNLIN